MGHFQYRRRFLVISLMIQKGASRYKNVRACYSSKNYLPEDALLARGSPRLQRAPWLVARAVTTGALDPRTTSVIEVFPVIEVLRVIQVLK